MWKNKLKQKFEEDPITVIIAGTFVLGTVVKAIDVLSGVQSRHAYAKQINKKTKK